MFCPKCGQDAGSSRYCPHCGNTVEAPAVTPTATTIEETKPDMPMKWFKFLIYFALWLSALSNLSSGLQLLTGAAYEGMAERVYAFFDGLQAVDLIFGLGSLALAGFAIYTRFQLAGFKKGSPKLLLMTYILACVLGLAYVLAAGAIIGMGDMNFASPIGSVIGAAIAVIVNKIYFDKRAHLFTN